MDCIESSLSLVCIFITVTLIIGGSDDMNSCFLNRF